MIGKVEEFWLNHDINCWSKNNLVYVGIVKNASTFYRNLFIKNDWQLLEFKNIDWENNQVFSFIQDPVVRYCKGITEDLYRNESLKEKIVPVLKDHLHDTVVLTHHTLPMSITCGENMYKITWIPIDVPGQKEILEEFLKKNNESIAWHIPHFSNKTTFDKKVLFKNIQFLLKDKNHLFWKLFSKDIDLYNQVILEHNNKFTTKP